MFGRLKLVFQFITKPSKAVPTAVTQVAEGKLGEGPKSVYWWLAGKKTWITVIVAGLAEGLSSMPAEQCEPCAQYGEWAWMAAGVLLVVGLWDGAIRAVPPKYTKKK
jgi:hypothetical protein